MVHVSHISFDPATRNIVLSVENNDRIPQRVWVGNDPAGTVLEPGENKTIQVAVSEEPWQKGAK